MTDSQRERRGRWLQIAGVAWTVPASVAWLFLLVVLSADQFLSAGVSAAWLIALGAAVVAVGPMLYGIGSWLRGELHEPVAGPRALR